MAQTASEPLTRCSRNCAPNIPALSSGQQMQIRDDLKWIDTWLREWARWMRDDHSFIERRLGYPARSAGFSTGGSGSADAFDIMCDDMDLASIRSIDRAVRALDGQHYAALMNHYINRVVRHRGDPEAILGESLEIIAVSAAKAGVA